MAAAHSLAPLFALVLGAGGLAILAPRIDPLIRTTEIQSSPITPPPLAGVDPRILNVLTLGHKNLYDDFAHLWMIQSLMTPYDPGLADAMMGSIRTVLGHHPKIETLYMLACFVINSEFKKPEYCQEIINAGLVAFPQSWRLPMTQGFIHAFLLDQPAQASAYFTMAASRAKSPPYVAKVAEKLIRKENLNLDDLNKSVELLMGTPYESRFREMLRNLPVSLPRQGPEAPMPEPPESAIPPNLEIPPEPAMPPVE